MSYADFLKTETYENFKKRFDIITREYLNGEPEYTEHQKDTIDKIVRAAFERKFSICLCGIPSSGKSTIFESLATTMSPPTTLNNSYGAFKVVSQSDILKDFMDKGLMSFHAYDSMNICVDDFGNGESTAHYKFNKFLYMGEFIEHRYKLMQKKKLFTHFSTNLIPNKESVKNVTYNGFDVKEFIGDRAYSRFKQITKVFNLGFTQTSIIDFRADKKDITNTNYQFDWKSYFEEADRIKREKAHKELMPEYLRKAIETYSETGEYYDFGQSIYNYLIEEKDELMQVVLSEKKDVIEELAVEKVKYNVQRNYDIAMKLGIDLHNCRIELNKTKNGEYNPIEMNIAKNQIALNFYFDAKLHETTHN
jgi:energy-coupling factor transporter ATP-binding protein EcfA2